MSLSHHQQRHLHRIGSGLLRSDPKLAVMLGIFGRLFAGEAMPSWEQVPTRRGRVRQAAGLIVQAMTLIVAAIGLLLRAIRVLVIVSTRRRNRLLAPRPERTRRGRGSRRPPDQAGQAYR